MEQVRIGVIGLGIMGELYVKIYAAHPLAKVVAVSSRRQSRVDEIQKQYGVDAGYTDYRKCWSANDLDAL